MSTNVSKISFEQVQGMLAQKLGVDVSTIKPETMLRTLTDRPDLADAVRKGVVGLMGDYFEARSDEVDMFFPGASTVVHPMSTMPLIINADTVHKIANSLYDFLDKNN